MGAGAGGMVISVRLTQWILHMTSLEQQYQHHIQTIPMLCEEVADTSYVCTPKGILNINTHCV